MAGQRGFFDVDERLAALSRAGDPLERLAAVVDFELFRADLEAALMRSDRAKGGRPPYDAVLMFRLLVLQALYSLSDDQAEYQQRDRLSFMRFVGLGLGDPMPDAKTIWLFREQLTRAGAIERLFSRFDATLRAAGYLAMGGQIVDATVVQARRPRLTAEEKATIRGGGVPEGWSKARAAQMDRDGRWTLKRGRKRPPMIGRADHPSRRAAGLASRGADERVATQLVVPCFGYKNHVGIDRRHGFIRTWTVTDAAAYDGGQLGGLLDADNTASDVWADTAYRSKANLALLERRGLVERLQRPKPKGKPMARNIRRGNATRAKVRVGVEHVVAVQKTRLKLVIRSVGQIRAAARLGLANLVTNLLRLTWLETRAASA
jgi:transposase, IS5 family